MSVQSTDQSAVAVRGLVRRFGSRTALDGVDLRVAPGEIHALLGPNGAGKTTLIRILAGLVEPHGGQVDRVGSVGLVPSGDRSLYLRISGIENLIFFGRMHGLRLRAARARAHVMLEQVGLTDSAGLAVGKYSHGMQKRLSVARALLVPPAVLLVDEATHDLDPEGARRIRGLVTDLAAGGLAVVWTTQRIEEIRRFADAVTLLRNGQVRFAGSVEALIAEGPDPQYLVRIRNGHPERPPAAAAMQRVLGVIANLSTTAAGSDQFLLTPATPDGFGAAVAALDGAGYRVLACRREDAEIESAFITLAESSEP